MVSKENKHKKKKTIREEYLRTFIGQAIASFIGVLIALISSIWLFGWNNLFIIFIVYLVYIVFSVFHSEIKNFIERKNASEIKGKRNLAKI